LKDSFYKVKPLIPRLIQIGLRKRYLLFQKKTPFPSWPIDLSLYEIYKNGIKEIAKSANMNEIPFINFWPENKKFAFVLTYDVETGTGQKNIWRVKEIEEELGFRSSWNFVPERYPLDEGLIQELKTSGFEIGIHGLKHDEKLFKNRKYFLKKVPKINYYLKKYNCLGFRSPMTWRNYEYMQHLNIQYDLSFFDSDIFEGQAGGTLSFHPFVLGKFVELPYTLPQDFTLFILLGERDYKI
jgi:peptidoglycan/xylan/chitin deacetylase (PgdA/CDA1 family)